MRSPRSSRPSRRAGGLPRRATPPGHGAPGLAPWAKTMPYSPKSPRTWLMSPVRSAYEPAADPVQHLCVLLGFGVDGDKTHPGAADRLPGSPHRHTRARAPDADPESPPTHRGRRFRFGGPLHITRSPASPSDEILPTHSPLTTRVEIPILSAMPAATACHRRGPQQPP